MPGGFGGRVSPRPSSPAIYHPCLAGLELRLGTTDPADPRQVQSVVPPTRTRNKDGTLSDPRRYVDVDAGCVRLPAALIDYLIDHLGRRRVAPPHRYETIPRETLAGLSPLEKVEFALEWQGIRPTPTERGLVACCPSHQGNRQNFAADEAEDGRVLIICHRGTCEFEDLVEAMGLEARDLYPERFRRAIRPRGHRWSNTNQQEARDSITAMTDEEADAWTEEQVRYIAALAERPEMGKELARRLGLPREAFRALSFGYRHRNPLKLEDGTWTDLGPAWTWEELDAKGRSVCINRRFVDPGVEPRKRIIGSRRDDPEHPRVITHRAARGLVYADDFRTRPGPVFVVEGESDFLAMSHLGAAAVGLPGAMLGLREVARLLEGDPRQVVVLGENDLKSDGSWPGDPRSAAERLAGLLGRAVGWNLPQGRSKDIREQVIDLIKGQ
jgi:hypothetical protein